MVCGTMAARIEVVLEPKNCKQSGPGRTRGCRADEGVRIVQVMSAVVCAVAGLLIFSSAGAAVSQQTNWTLEMC